MADTANAHASAASPTLESGPGGNHHAIARDSAIAHVRDSSEGQNHPPHDHPHHLAEFLEERLGDHWSQFEIGILGGYLNTAEFHF